MSRIALEPAVREALARNLVRHLKTELDVEIAPFDGVALLDFLAETLGPHYYNQGLADARSVVRARLDTVLEAVEDLEKPLKT